MRTLTKKDNPFIIFGEWFDKANGNTYYDATIKLADGSFNVPYRYGYNHGDKQAIDEVLAECGLKVRKNNKDVHAPYRDIHTVCVPKLKRELHK